MKSGYKWTCDRAAEKYTQLIIYSNTMTPSPYRDHILKLAGDLYITYTIPTMTITYEEAASMDGLKKFIKHLPER